MKVIEKEIVVIGAGIIGTTIAERLSYEGHRVCLLDRLTPGEGCSKGHAGHFATDIVLPLANFKTILSVPRLLMDPLGPLSIRWRYFPKLIPWLTRFMWAAMPHKAKATSDALVSLNRPSIRSYSELLQRTNLEYLMVKKGALTVYEQDVSMTGHRSTIELLRDYGVELQILTGAQVRELEPAVSEGIKGGLYFPNTAHTINPLVLVTSLAEKISERGGEILQGNVQRIEVQDMGKPNIILDDGDTICANKIVIAAGAWSKRLASMTGFNVPLETERGYHLMLPEPCVELSRPITSFERSFVMTPMQEGLRLAGTVELGGLKAAMNNARADILYDHAINILPKLGRANATRWMGFRPSLPDSLPIIDQSPKHAGVFYAFGHQHLGLTQAAVTAEIMSDLISARNCQIDTRPFKVDRF